MASKGQRDTEIETHVGRTPESEFWYFAKAERGFIANPELENASSGDTASLWFRNPSGSGRTGVFVGVSSSPATRSYARIYDTFETDPSGGTAATIDNVILGTEDSGPPDTGVVEAYTNPDFNAPDASNVHMSSVVGGGTGNSSVGDTADMPILAVEPGRDAVLEVEKLTSGPDQAPLRGRWFEVPCVYSERNVDPPIDEAIRSGFTG